jgi:hypothetical protein
MNWFKKKNKENSEREKVETLKRISIMTELMKHGYLFLDIQNKRVVISDKVAVLFLGSQEKWKNFLQNIYSWFVYRASQLAWQKYFQDVEVKAVREARKKFALLTQLQEKTIRQEARAAVNIDAVRLPQIEAYDFIISNDISGGEEPKVIAVGRYANGTFDMIPYEEVKSE